MQWIDVWCCFFDAELNYFDGGRSRFSYDTHSVKDGLLYFDTQGFLIAFNESQGVFRGKVLGQHGPIEVDLSWSQTDDVLGEGYGIFPFSWMLNTPIPKQKTITPIGLAKFSGGITTSSGRLNVLNWYGCQGHNWGVAHTPAYVWLHALLCEGQTVIGTCEAFSGRVQLGSRSLGPFSGARVQIADQTYTFNRLVDTWNQQSHFEVDRFQLSLQKGDQEATIDVKANLAHVLCLGYEDPNGHMHYCMNSKLASLSLTLKLSGKIQHFKSPHCTALEWLTEQTNQHVI